MKNDERPNAETLSETIKAGVAELERGDYTEVADEDLDAFLDALAAGG